MKNIFKVVAQGEAYAVQSQKAENGQLMKCNIVLQEVNGQIIYNFSNLQFTIYNLVI